MLVPVLVMVLFWCFSLVASGASNRGILSKYMVLYQGSEKSMFPISSLKQLTVQ